MFSCCFIKLITCASQPTRTRSKRSQHATLPANEWITAAAHYCGLKPAFAYQRPAAAGDESAVADSLRLWPAAAGSTPSYMGPTQCMSGSP